MVSWSWQTVPDSDPDAEGSVRGPQRDPSIESDPSKHPGTEGSITGPLMDDSRPNDRHSFPRTEWREVRTADLADLLADLRDADSRVTVLTKEKEILRDENLKLRCEARELYYTAVIEAKEKEDKLKRECKALKKQVRDLRAKERTLRVEPPSKRSRRFRSV